MTTAMRERNRKRLRRVMLDTRTKMYTGRLVNGVASTAGAPTNKTWVRYPANSTEETLAWGNVLRPDVPVWVQKNKQGQNEIVGVEYVEGTVKWDNALETVGAHPVINEIQPTSVGEFGILPGRVSASPQGSTYIRVQAFEHSGGRYPTTDIDVGAEYPAGDDTYGRIGVYLDPDTNTVTAFAGEEVFDRADFTDADKLSVPDGMYPLGAVIVYDGNDISGANTFEDWRLHHSSKGSGVAGSIVVSDGTTDVDPTVLLSFDPVYFDVTDGGSDDALVTFIGEAEDIPYDNSTSGLTATDAQAAIDELKAEAFINPLTTTGDLLTVSDTPLLNSDRSGIDDLGSGASETVIGDCDLTLIVATGGIDVGINVWWSMNQPSVPKNVTLRLRRDSVSGSVLASNGQGASIDSSAGHDRQWNTTYNDNTPTTGRYVLTFQRTAGGVNVISDTREFSLTAQSPNPARLAVGNAGQVLKSDGTVPEWGATAEYSTANVTNPPTDAELDSTFGTPATVGAGFLGVVNDNNGGTNEYLCWSDGANWFYVTGTKAT